MERFFGKIFGRGGASPIAADFANWKKGGNKISIVENSKPRDAELEDVEYLYSLGFFLCFDGSSANNTLSIAVPQKRFELDIRFEDASNSGFSIGENSEIHNSRIRIQHGQNAKISIGKNNGIYGMETVVKGGTTLAIGKGCLLAEGVKIRTGDAHLVIDRANGQILNFQREPLVIGNHCWICKDVRILKNAWLADNTIIGESSVVGRKFAEPFSMIAGNPARIIKEDVEWRK